MSRAIAMRWVLLTASLIAAPMAGLAQSGAAAVSASSQAAQTAQGETVQLDLRRAHAIALQALKDGKPEVTQAIARALIARNPDDGYAQFLLASSLGQLGGFSEGRRAAAAAFKLAPQKTDRFRAAQLAARLSFDAGQPTRAQYWLRRSLPFAPHDQARDQVVRDFRVVRAKNPLSFNLNINALPSSNVNGGSQENDFYIDGVAMIPLSISAHDQALKGTTLSADLQASYRLRESDKSETRLVGVLAVNRVILSQEAFDLAASTPTTQDDDISNGDFSSTLARIGLRHVFALPVGEGHRGSLAAWLGQTWYGGVRYQDLARVEAGSRWQIAPDTEANLDWAWEKRRYVDRSYGTTASRTATAKLHHRLGSGDVAGITLSHVDTDGTARNSTHRRLTAAASYRFAKAFGPAKISLELGVSRLDGTYHAFTAVPREDKAVFGSARFLLEGYDYAGFSPSLTLKARKNASNISRYDTKEVSIGFGIESSF